MSARLAPIDNEVAAIHEITRRLDRVEDMLVERLLPPGYVINVVAGSVIITRTADNATTTLVFA